RCQELLEVGHAGRPEARPGDHTVGRDRIGLGLAARPELQRCARAGIERHRVRNAFACCVAADRVVGVVAHDADHGEARVAGVTAVEIGQRLVLLLAGDAPRVPEVTITTLPARSLVRTRPPASVGRSTDGALAPSRGLLFASARGSVPTWVARTTANTVKTTPAASAIQRARCFTPAPSPARASAARPAPAPPPGASGAAA